MNETWKGCDPNCRRCKALERINGQKTQVIKRLEGRNRELEALVEQVEREALTLVASSGGSRR